MLNQNDLKQIRSIVSAEIKPLARDIQIIDKKVSKIQKDLDVVIRFFDREYLELLGRVERIEKHLGITALT